MRGTFSYRSALFILLLGVFTYLYGLDSRFAPKNGDEYPYMHIVRMTADSGHWLPLQSEMDGIKNKVGLEIQFGKYAFMGYDIFSKMIIFKNLKYIECGVEIVPSSELVKQMSTGVSSFEQLLVDVFQSVRLDVVPCEAVPRLECGQHKRLHVPNVLE